MDVEEISAVVVDAAFRVHRELGPGLLESVYEVVLARSLEKRGLKVERQKTISFDFDGLRFDEGLRVDLLVDGSFIVEIKSIDQLGSMHHRQLLTYLRLLRMPVGLLINFGSPTFREGIKRVVNNHTSTATSRLHVNQEPLQ